MTTEEVTLALENIKTKVGNWETTHALSDDLYEAVLLSIADGTTADPAGIARAAVDGIKALDYTRWYA